MEAESRGGLRGRSPREKSSSCPLWRAELFEKGRYGAAGGRNNQNDIHSVPIGLLMNSKREFAPAAL